MASTKDHRISNKEALLFAEQADVSPQQANDLAKGDGKDKGEKEKNATTKTKAGKYGASLRSEFGLRCDSRP